ncbi:MAG: P-loop NTPase [Candidatus Lokiarchaeota archaeon]|nr:P-loop NTPase [Candidatus Lokiarchaeota archaeon]
MLSKKEIIDQLKNVLFPGLSKSIAELGLVKNINIKDDKNIDITFALPSLNYPGKEDIEAHSVVYLKDKLELENINVNFEKMEPQEHQAFQQKLTKEEQMKLQASMIPKYEKHQLKNVLVVTSGKGGVGKSFVTSMLATELHRKGLSVGVLDADITGSSIAKFFGLKQRPVVMNDKIVPVETNTGIKVISMNLLLPEETNPVLWRGPLINKVLEEFYEKVEWGPLDILLLDLPPGTSDTHLTIFQSYPVDGIVFVSTPQDLATMIVQKGINMANIMKVPILGLVENMTHIVCPNCGEKINLFGQSQGLKVATKYNTEYLGRIPLDPKISSYTDEGKIEKYTNDNTDKIAENVKANLELD